MPLTNHGHLSLQKSNGRPLCPQCSAPLWIVRVEPDKIASDKRAFQCPRCEYSHVEALPSKERAASCCGPSVV
jgi:transposase-like protein